MMCVHKQLLLLSLKASRFTLWKRECERVRSYVYESVLYLISYEKKHLIQFDSLNFTQSLLVRWCGVSFWATVSNHGVVHCTHCVHTTLKKKKKKTISQRRDMLVIVDDLQLLTFFVIIIIAILLLLPLLLSVRCVEIFMIYLLSCWVIKREFKRYWLMIRKIVYAVYGVKSV